MKIFVFVFSLLLFASTSSHSQEIPAENFKIIVKNSDRVTLNSLSSDNLTSGEILIAAAAVVAWIVNPIIVYEDKHVDLGLTKEVSLYIIPYVRFAGEYSRIFRVHNKNHWRASVNAEIPLLVSDFAILTGSVGGGYFTDLTHDGYFPQASFSIMLYPIEHIGTNIYIKTRYTFITQEEKSNIFDLTAGAGLIFWF